MLSSLFVVFVFAVATLAVWRTSAVYGSATGMGAAVGLTAVSFLLPLGNLVALVVAAGALGLARSEERRRLGA